MELSILQGLQQDIKIFLLVPIIEAILDYVLSIFLLQIRNTKVQRNGGTNVSALDFGGEWI